MKDYLNFINLINSVYEKDDTGVTTQGAYANQLFNAYSSASPIMVMPAGEFEWNGGMALDATFENYVPLLYGNNVTNRFMTVVAVQHDPGKGTASANSIGDYGNGTGDNYGPLYLSMYTQDVNNTPGDDSDDVIYFSRKVPQLLIRGVLQQRGQQQKWQPQLLRGLLRHYKPRLSICLIRKFIN